MDIIRHGGGIKLLTGHPVIIDVIIIDAKQAAEAFEKKVLEKDMERIACIEDPK